MSYEDTLRQYLEAAIPSRSVSPIPLERDQEIPPYEGTDETQQTLARLLGPLPNSPQLQEPPSLPPPFDRLPDTSAWVASRTDQQPPLTASSRFLANAPRSLSDAEQFADMSPAEIDLRRLYGPTAKIGLGDLMRMRTAHGEGLLSALAQQRQMSAYQQAQIQQRQQEHDQDLLQAALKDPKQLEALSTMPNYGLAQQAKMIFKSFKDADYMSFPAYQKIIEDMDPGFTQRFFAGQVDYYDFQAHLNEARNFKNEEAKAKAKSSVIQRALDTPAEQRSAYQKQLVEEHEATVGLKKADTDLKWALADKARRDANAPRPSDLLGHTREAITQELFSGKYGPQVIFKQLSPDEKAKVNQAVAKYEGGITGQRTASSQLAMDQVPVGRQGKAQEFRDPITGRAAPSWVTPADLYRVGAVNVEPTQVGVIGQLRNVDEALDEILAGGNVILRDQGVSTWDDVATGMMQRPLVNVIRKYAGDPAVAKMESAMNRITPTLSRLGGDVANVAVAEREMYKDSIFSSTDTVQSFAAKIQSIKDANRRTRVGMGFFPDLKSYISSLVSRGMSEKEIDAIMEQRKRIFGD